MTARSQEATNWQPAVVATPATSAITGFGQRTIDSMRFAQVRMVVVKKPRLRSASARAPPSVPSERGRPRAIARQDDHHAHRRIGAGRR